MSKSFLQRGILLLWILCNLPGDHPRANVSIRNGNFYIEYTDFSFLRGVDLKLERVYNSKSPFLGMFGYGWGTEFETQGQVNPDGSVMIKESGSGAENIFEPVVFDMNAKAAALDLIVKNKKSGSALELAEYRNRLTTDRDFLLTEWARLIKDKKITPFEVPTGSRLVSTRFGYQILAKTVNGYERVYPTGKVETFDNSGRLVRVTDVDRNFFEIIYNDSGLIDSIRDNYSNRAVFYFNDQKLVDSIVCLGAVKGVCRYRYNDKSQLIYTEDFNGTWYTHEYDNRHNMTRIGYDDSTTMEIRYWGDDLYENVRFVKDRDGSFTTYEYEEKKIREGEDHLLVKLRYYDADSVLITSSDYRYEIITTSEGVEMVMGLYTNYDGDISYTQYDDRGNTVLYVNDNDTTNYVYNSKSLLTRKETRGEIIEYQYSPECLKRVMISETQKATKESTWTKLDYDNSCRVKKIERSTGEFVELTYNPAGKVVVILVNDGESYLEYNSQDKVARIKNKFGSIQISYSETGEVKSVDSESPGDKKLKIMEGFQQYLELVRYAD